MMGTLVVKRLIRNTQTSRPTRQNNWNEISAHRTNTKFFENNFVPSTVKARIVLMLKFASIFPCKYLEKVGFYFLDPSFAAFNICDPFEK